MLERTDVAGGHRRFPDLPVWLILAGVALTGGGMAITIGGILAPAIFIPGLVVIGTGLAVLALAGIAGVVLPEPGS